MLKMKKIDKKYIVSNLNNHRIYYFLVIVLIIMSIGAPGFMRSSNLVPLLRASLLPIVVGVGFTFVMIAGHFDLSIGSVINVGAIVVMGEFNRFFYIFGGRAGGTSAVVWAWIIAIIIAMCAGGLVGLINGLVVGKGKVHSFIVTIGTLTAMSGFVYTYSKGNTISADSYMLVDVIEKSLVKIPYLSVISWRFFVTIAVLIFFEILLLKTRWGKDLFMVGSNNEAAWQAGIDTDKKIIWSFVISGLCAALGGILFAISMNAAVPNYGERGINPLMLVLASTIIGGTVMTGGAGSVVKTAVAVITIQCIFNGLIGMGLGFDAQVLAAGILLGVVVLAEAYILYKQSLNKGQRPFMLPEAELLKSKQKDIK